MRRLPRTAMLAAICVIALAAGAGQGRAADVDAAAAKKEGKVVWYTSTPVETAQKIAKLFESET
ncbi:MAG: hypothetical protein WAN86_11245, partial [Hyphomicrobiaceae bacterium]